MKPIRDAMPEPRNLFLAQTDFLQDVFGPPSTCLMTAPTAETCFLQSPQPNPPRSTGFTVTSGEHKIEPPSESLPEIPLIPLPDRVADPFPDALSGATPVPNNPPTSDSVDTHTPMVVGIADPQKSGGNDLKSAQDPKTQENSETSVNGIKGSKTGTKESDSSYAPSSMSDSDGGDIEMKCPKCQQVFGDRSSLRRHMLRSHSDDAPRDFMCTNCGRRCRNSQNLRRHMNNAHSGADEKCDLCPATFATKRSLSLHKRDAHGVRGKGRRIGKVVNCSLCSYSSHQAFNVKRHFRNVHAQTMEFPCPFGCGRVCRSKANLKTHQMVCRQGLRGRRAG